MREFNTGATRDTDEGKLDFEGFLSPVVLKRYAEYMHENRVQADGNLRDSDNWQKGIPQEAYVKSGWRHFFAFWSAWRRGDLDEAVQDACALLFNIMGWLHEQLKDADAIDGYDVEGDPDIEVAVFNFSAKVLGLTLPWGHPVYRCTVTDNLMVIHPKVPGHRLYITESRLIEEGLLPDPADQIARNMAERG